MVVTMETLVNFRYGPHPGYPALPWKQGGIATTLKNPDRTLWLLCNNVSMATQGIPDADHIEYRLGSPWQQPWQPAFFYPDLQDVHEIFLNYNTEANKIPGKFTNRCDKIGSVA